MIVKVKTVLPADIDTVFKKLQEIKTLQYICKPFAKFTPLDKKIKWREGEVFMLNLKVLCFDFGIHTINVKLFEKGTILTHESNIHVPVWNHRIELIPKDENHTEYTDIVEIRAGWKTFFIWIWANLFYRHRQNKWRDLL